MTEIDISVSVDDTRPLPVPVTGTDLVLIAGGCDLMGWSFREASGDTSAANEGSVTSPAAGTTITSVTIPAAGQYNVAWTVELGGALAAADSNNFEMTNGGVVVTPSVNPAVAGNYIQPGLVITVAAGAVIAVKNIALATVGAIYSAEISVTPVSQTEAQIEIQDSGNQVAELSLSVGGSDTHDLGDRGLHIRDMLKIHVVQGIVTGVVYARFDTC